MRRVSEKKQRISGGEEIEVKLRVADRRALLRQLRRLHARLEKGRVHEMNLLYDTGDAALARNGQLLRIRVERAAGRAGNGPKRARGGAAGAADVLLTFKGPPRGLAGRSRQAKRYKVREEREVRVEDADGLAGVLEGIGLRKWFRYEKYRSSYRLPGLRGVKVELDETPIGDFLELEGDRNGIDQAAARMGFDSAEYIDASYGALYREWCEKGRAREGPREPRPWGGLGDMVFRGRK